MNFNEEKGVIAPSLSPAATDELHGSLSVRSAVLILLVFALAVRLVVLIGVRILTHGQEINDDYLLYVAMTRHPLMLLTGIGAQDLGDGGIYAPLVPLQLWFPGELFSRAVGPVLGRRLGMLIYDVAALAIALWVAFRVAGVPRTWRQWLVAATLAILPASVGASVVWGQEDSAVALWSALTLACYLFAGPLPAMWIAGAGLFTCKLFFVILMLGLWLASPGSRKRLAAAGALCVAAFGAFLLIRWRVSGFLYPEYHYRSFHNTPSGWAVYRLVKGIATEPPYKYIVKETEIRTAVQVVTSLAMLAISAAAWRRRLNVWSSVVAVHCAFFATFIGIHPEHYQWFLPFLIVFAWDAMRRGKWLALMLSVVITYLAYGYKIVYGLRGGAIGNTTAGSTAGSKEAIRNLIESHIGFDLYWVQLGLIFVTLATLVLLMREALRIGKRETPAAT